MNSVEKPSWGLPAAYLYVLKLDAALWAWEYLRRNLRYRRDYDCASTGGPARSPRSWGLASWENPREDGRTAEPQWLIGEDPEILLRRARVGEASPSFDFWAIQGHKMLLDKGDHLSLTVRAGSEVLRRVQLANDLWVGDPVAISVTGATGIVARAHAAERLLRSLKCGAPAALPERPSLTALTHMQTLLALDGTAAGASQREIARALFGPSTDLSWSPDSQWRARVRYLVKCGRARCEEGYRHIVGGQVERSPRNLAVPHGSLSDDAIPARSAV